MTHARSLLMFTPVLLAVLGATPDRPPAAAPVRTLVVVGGALTELVYALGAGADVVAVDVTSVYPPENAKVPRLGHGRSLSVEAVAALHPSAVLVEADKVAPATVEQLRALGLTVHAAPAVSDWPAALERVTWLGGVLGRAASATALRRTMDASLQEARLGCKGGGRALVLYARGAGTVLAAGTGTPAAAWLSAARFSNAAGSMEGFKPVAPEWLHASAPDWVLVPSHSLRSLDGAAGLWATPGLTGSPAHRRNQLLERDALSLLELGPRTPDTVRDLCAAAARGATP